MEKKAAGRSLPPLGKGRERASITDEKVNYQTYEKASNNADHFGTISNTAREKQRGKGSTFW